MSRFSCAFFFELSFLLTLLPADDAVVTDANDNDAADAVAPVASEAGAAADDG